MVHLIDIVNTFLYILYVFSMIRKVVNRELNVCFVFYHMGFVGGTCGACGLVQFL